jgi:hypothetical protein
MTTPKEHVAAFEDAHPGALGTLQDMARKSGFASDMISRIRARGFDSLSQRQREATLRMVAREEARAAAEVALMRVGGQSIMDALAAAQGSGLKKPKLRAAGITISTASSTGSIHFKIHIKPDGDEDSYAIFKPLWATDDGQHLVGSMTPEAAAQIVAGFTQIARDPHAAAIEYGRQTGTCACCGRTLTDPESVRLGIGPVCRKNWGWA